MMEQNTNLLPLPARFRRVLPEGRVLPVQERFTKLFSSCEKPTNKAMFMHLHDYILPGLALYQLLREGGKDQAEALAEVDKTLECMVVQGQVRMRRYGRLPFIYPLLRVLIKPIMNTYPAPGWSLEWVENSPQAIRFNMKSCYYFDVLSRFGAPELTASFCRTDDLVYDGMSPYLEWRRTQTIGRGAGYCDFCFARASKEVKK